MSSRSLNKVQLIGNLTRDPELRYTPQGTAVCTFGLATNRSWTTEGGEKREEAEFHRIVAWNKLAELCSQLLFKGRKVYVEGRLQTRTWTAQDGSQRQSTEVVIEEMIILDSRQAEAVEATGVPVARPAESPAPADELPPIEEPQVSPEEPVVNSPGGATEPVPVEPPTTDKKKKTEKSEGKNETPSDKGDLASDIPF